MNKELPDLAFSRRSTRQFSGQPLEDGTIRAILDIAAYAPSSWGGHPVEYIVVRDKETLAQLARCKAMGAGPLSQGEAAIVPIVDRRKLELWVEDGAVASTYLLLAAEHCGVGACWIHMKDRKGHTGTTEEDIRQLLGIPEHYGILNVVSLGQKAGEDAPRPPLKPAVHWESY